ncbi:hypothetical protein [Hydrogenimonas sp.]
MKEGRKGVRSWSERIRRVPPTAVATSRRIDVASAKSRKCSSTNRSAPMPKRWAVTIFRRVWSE